MTHLYMWHDTPNVEHAETVVVHRQVTWLIRDMTQSCVTWRICICDMTHQTSNMRTLLLLITWWTTAWDSVICVTWLIHMCDMTHSYVWHDSFICVTWLSHTCDRTHLYVWHDTPIVEHDMLHSVVHHSIFSFHCNSLQLNCCSTCDVTHQTLRMACSTLDSRDMAHNNVVIWHTTICDMTHINVWHVTQQRVTWHTSMCDVTHNNVWYNTQQCVTHCRCSTSGNLLHFYLKIAMHCCITLESNPIFKHKCSRSPDVEQPHKSNF